MDKRRSYIYERTYMEYQNRKREDEVESYWKDILGEDIIQHLKEKTYYQIYDNLSTDVDGNFRWQYKDFVACL